MNDRLHELAEQATQKFSRFGERDSWETLFAELIVRDTLDQVAEFNRLTKAYQTQGIDPEIDVTKEVLKNYRFTRFPIGVE